MNLAKTGQNSMNPRKQSALDRLIGVADSALRTLSTDAHRAARKSPAEDTPESELTADQRHHVAGLMRVNHCGEVCAQALYQGQALTARLPEVRGRMAEAAGEEIDHLVWCEQRLRQLGGRTSVLNPGFYALSFLLGAAAGLAGDRYSLGFVAATEERVVKHLQRHLQRLPAEDQRSRRIVQQMLEDEGRHGALAAAAGGREFPAPVKGIMDGVAKLMTETTYRI